MTLNLIACASGIAGADVQSGEGPLVIHRSPQLAAIEKSGLIRWQRTISPSAKSVERKDKQVGAFCTELAVEVSALVAAKKPFCVIGGDHSCAIGTWSGVYDALHEQGEIGLIWIDAHLDAHTPETTPSGNIHGMPVACLLGLGYSTLTSILHDAPKIKPENLCIIGVRSYEVGEAALLEQLNVKIYFMDEIESRGFAAVMQEAVERVSKQTIAYGISLDIDAIDPQEAPGVDVPEAGGIKVLEIMAELKNVMSDKKLIGTEVVEFDPAHDHQHITENVVIDILKIIAGV